MKARKKKEEQCERIKEKKSLCTRLTVKIEQWHAYLFLIHSGKLTCKYANC